MYRKHSSDARLMARLDGELSCIARWAVEWHLKSCWMCRARSAGLEAQAEAVANAYEKAVFPDPQRTAEAKLRFLQSVERVEKSDGLPTFSGLRPAFPAKWRPALAAMVLLSLGIVGLFAYRSNPVLRTDQILTLAKQKSRQVSSASLRRSVLDLGSSQITPVLNVRPESRGEGLPSIPVFEPPKLNSLKLDEVEMEVRYILHQHRACRGEAVEVNRTDTQVLVDGVVESAEREQELLSALAQTSFAAAVPLHIRTISEAVASEGGFDAPGHSAAGHPLIGRAPSKLLVEIELEKYLGEHPGNRFEALRILSIANDTLSLSSAVLDDAWALRRLAIRYGDQRKPPLSTHAQGLLMLMVHDHAGWTRQSSDRIRSQVEPLFARMKLAQLSIPPMGSAAPDLPEWPASCEQLFEKAQRLRRITEELFAGGGMYMEEDKRALVEPQAGKDAKAELHDLAVALSELQFDTGLVLARSSRQVSAGTRPLESDRK